MRTVLVAGASRGIGAAVALAFAREPARLVLTGRAPADLERLAGEVRALGAEAVTVAGDVCDRARREAAVAAAGAVDVLVYNAGTNVPQPFADVAEATYDRIFDVNVRAGFFLAQAAAARMAAGGCIVFLSSQMGHVGARERTVYCASKHAVEGLVKALAMDLAPRGVRVVSVAPTFVRTDLTAPQLDDPEVGARLLAQIPLGRFASAEEVASAVTWVASPGAAMVTGTSLRVDGGWTAR